jgi:hypothetical protein
MSDQHDIGEVFSLEHPQDVRDMGVQANVSRCEMRALAVAG